MSWLFDPLWFTPGKKLEQSSGVDNQTWTDVEQYGFQMWWAQRKNKQTSLLLSHTANPPQNVLFARDPCSKIAFH